MKLTKANNPTVTDAKVEPLIQMLNGIAPQPEAIIQYFKKHAKILSVKSGQMLLKEGAVCEEIYFINSGVIRGFIREGKREVTTWMSADNEVVTSITSLDLAVPALENIQAIEHCELIVLPNKSVTNAYDLFPEFNFTGRKILQQYYRDAEMRAYIIRLSNAENKYRFFLSNYSHLSNRVQLQYIASFLGISIETLSRVRKKMSSRT